MLGDGGIKQGASTIYLMETVKMTVTVSTWLDEIMISWLELGAVIKNCFKNSVIIMNTFFF